MSNGHVAEAEKRWRDATSGMWELTVDPDSRSIAEFKHDLTEGDMVFIVYARLDIKRLLREVKRLNGVCDNLAKEAGYPGPHSCGPECEGGQVKP